MVLAFLFSWVPFGWMYVLPLLDIQQRGHRATTDVLPLFAVKLGCAIINPLVYSFTNLQVLLYYYSYNLIFIDITIVKYSYWKEIIYSPFYFLVSWKSGWPWIRCQYQQRPYVFQIKDDREKAQSLERSSTYWFCTTKSNYDTKWNKRWSRRQNLIKTENEINVSLEHDVTQHVFGNNASRILLSNDLLLGMEH